MAYGSQAIISRCGGLAEQQFWCACLLKRLPCQASSVVMLCVSCQLDSLQLVKTHRPDTCKHPVLDKC